MAERRSRPEKLDPFFPPRPSRSTLWLMERLMPLLLRFGWQIEAVEIPEADRARLRALRTSRALVISNHPSLAEPGVLFQVLRRERVSFFPMTAWDTMTAFGRLSVGLFQGLGAYSVRRGRRDRPAMETTEELLVRGERVLVFPEGQTYGLNDALLPFQQGVLLMGFRALETMERGGTEAPLLVQPMAVRYVYRRPMRREIDASLARLEAALALKDAGKAPYVRLRRIATTLAERLEQEYGVPPASGGDLNGRIDALRATVAERLACALGIDPPADTDTGAVVQALANAYDDFLEKDRPAESDAAVGDVYRRWLHLKNFVAVRDGYVSEWPSAERFVDVLRRMEADILGKTRIRAPRVALARAAEPIDLRDHLPAYREKRRETLAGLTDRLEGEVRALLDESRSRTAPLEELGAR